MIDEDDGERQATQKIHAMIAARGCLGCSHEACFGDWDGGIKASFAAISSKAAGD
jgi:hypothetical protein